MKTKILTAIAVYCILFFIVIVPPSVRAEDSSLTLPSEVTVELSADGIILPIVNVNGEYSYRIAIYDITDTSYENSIAEGISKFIFEKPGDYLLKYTFEKKGTSNIYLYSKLSVVDNTAPVIKLAETREEYRVGSNIIIDYTVADNSGFLPVVSARIYLNGREYFDLNGSNTFIPTDSGDYEVVIRATDRGGLSTEEKRMFSVVGESSTNREKTLTIVLILIVSLMAVALGVFIVIFVRRKKVK